MGQDLPRHIEMPLGDHIEELRARVIWALYFLGISIGICLFFQEQLMEIAIYPHNRTMRAVLDNQPPDPNLIALETAMQDFLASQPKTPQDQNLSRLLQKNIAYLKSLNQRQRESSMKLKIMRYQSGFMAYLKVSFIFGFFLGAPFALYQLWGFASSGLYPSEKKYVYIFAPVSYLAFFGGSVFGYLVLIPLGLQYLSTFANPEIAENFISIDWYLSLFFAMTLAVGLIFELPLLMLFLAKLDIFDMKDFLNYWRHWIVASLIIGAVLTPPDPVTQILLALPMCLLYGVGIILIYFLGNPPEKEEEERENL